MDLARIKQILERNQDKSFVKRILRPGQYPSLDLGDGWEGTHLMAADTVKGHPIVYPTILWDGEKLTQFNREEALKQVLKTGNYITFDSLEEAIGFSKDYKQYWTQ